VSFNFVIARNEPGAAVAQGHDRSEPFRYAMIYANFGWER
jgi:hypothetical protein